MPPDGGIRPVGSPDGRRLFALCLLFALLIGDAAAGLAGGLAARLAFAAAAVLGALAQIAGIQSLDVLHNGINLPLLCKFRFILSQRAGEVNAFPRDRIYFGFIKKMLIFPAVSGGASRRAARPRAPVPPAALPMLRNWAA